jgi:hypothetical protein
MLHHAVIEILSTQVSVSSSSFHLIIRDLLTNIKE